MSLELGRNEPCHCGSGKKYKKCHLEGDEQADRKRRDKAALNVTSVGSEGSDAPRKPEKDQPETKKSWLRGVVGKGGVLRRFAQRKSMAQKKG